MKRRLATFPLNRKKGVQSQTVNVCNGANEDKPRAGPKEYCKIQLSVTYFAALLERL